MPRSGWTLARSLALTLVGLVLLLAGLFYHLLHAWQRSLTESALEASVRDGSRIASVVEATLYSAQKALTDLETRIRLGASRSEDRAALETDLHATLLANPELSEVTFTRALMAPGATPPQPLMAGGRWQLSVFRSSGEEGAAILARHSFERGGFASGVRPLLAGSRPPPLAPQGRAPDPTEHATFVATVSPRFYGRAIWTDLHYTELDSHLPEPRRRVAVDVMQAVEDEDGRFAGVLRVGLLTRQVDRLLAEENARNASYRVFICDDGGRLVSRGDPTDRLREEPDESLRIPLADVGLELRAAIAHPALTAVGPDSPQSSGQLQAGRERWLITFQRLGRSQDWRVAVLARESIYLEQLVSARNRLLGSSLVVLVGALVGGAVMLGRVRRGLSQIVEAAERMRGFDFAPAETRSSFADVQQVMGSVELAKTALRAMSKYVPVDLVRHLYRTRREPVLGGELVEVSLLFSDIEGFTRLAESLEPNELARLLGRYLEAITKAIHGTEGVIDKYIGDAVMALWNAAAPCPEHPLRACEAALAWRDAERELYASSDWEGRPPLVTRVGIHTDRVMVGHFGAPDRMSFTALGDGVNLASRLESLNKQYGTTLLVSEAVVARARDAFAFRLLDRVAVKGKIRGVTVYELLGREGLAGPVLERAQAYERALDAYWNWDFAGALRILATLDGDPPGLVLAERCRALSTDPPPADWDGIWVAPSK